MFKSDTGQLLYHTICIDLDIFLKLGVEMNQNLGCPRDNENVSYTGNRYIHL